MEASMLNETMDNLQTSIYQNMNDTDFNSTSEPYLEDHMAIPITIVYVSIFITGVVGNVAVCVVIVRHASMHTATNYYLFSLSVSDLTLLLLGLPHDLSLFWHPYPWRLGVGICKFRALLSEAASYVSVLTIVAFSTERYLAICHPLHLYTMSGLQRPVRIIALLWTVSLASAVPFAVFTNVNYLEDPPGSGHIIQESAFCAMISVPEGWPVLEISSILFFVIPMLILMVLYIRMGLRIRNRTRHSLGKGVNGSVHGATRHSQSRKAIIRMLAAVVIAFFVCWAPFHAQRLLYTYMKEYEWFSSIHEWVFHITGVLYYVTSTVNPILYNVMSNRYRVAFRETLCGGKRNSSNGFVREQSSFRETMIGTTYESTQLVRVRSVTGDRMHNTGSNYSSRYNSMRKDISGKNNTIQWQENLITCEVDKGLQEEKEVKVNNLRPSDVVVIVSPSSNSRTKCFTTSTNLNQNDFQSENKNIARCDECEVSEDRI